MRCRLGVLALTLAMIVPAAEAQGPVTECRQQCAPRDEDLNGPNVKEAPPVDLVLYAHFRDATLRGDLNTQSVDPLREPDVRAAITLGGVIPSNGGATIHLESLSSLIDRAGRSWSSYNELGLADDVKLAREPVLYIYLSASNAAETGPALVPRLGVAAELRQGAPTRPGPLVADSSGTDAQITLVNDGASEEDVYEVKVVLHPVQPTIKQATTDPTRNRFFVKIRLYQVAAGTAAVTQADWRFHTGARFPPRLILSVTNPLHGQDLDVEARPGNVVFQWRVHSPLGSYDVDPGSFSLDVVGGDGSTRRTYSPTLVDSDPRRADSIAVWQVPAALFRDGEKWFVNATATNHQGTYRLLKSWSENPLVKFEGSDASVPAPAALGAAVAILVGLLVTRPRTGRPARTER